MDSISAAGGATVGLRWNGAFTLYAAVLLSMVLLLLNSLLG